VVFKPSCKVVNGAFAVFKDADSDRLIIDARSTNRIFVDPPKVKLPTPDLLAQLKCSPHTSFFVSKCDLDNFYHRIRLPQHLVDFFGLPPVLATDVGLLGYPAGTKLYPCCTTLPMGWSHSVYLAQQAHEHTIYTRTSLKPEDAITADNDKRLDRQRHMIYIDDFITVGLDSGVLEAQQDEYVAAVADAGIPHKPSKRFAPTADGLECVGFVVHGRDHTVGVDPNKLLSLVAETLRIVSSSSCTGHTMSQLVGSWTWASMTCRPVLSVLNSVYRFIQAARRREFGIWPSVRRELLVLVGLAPFLSSNLSQGWCPHVVATDASSTGLGVCSSTLDVSTVANAACARVPTHDTGDLPNGVSSSGWRNIVSHRWRDFEHINVLELRATLTGLKWLLSRPISFRRRVFFLCDSQVVTQCLSKGRSSSPPLLRLLRQLAALQLAFSTFVRIRWIRSELNPADKPSRC